MGIEVEEVEEDGDDLLPSRDSRIACIDVTVTR